MELGKALYFAVAAVLLVSYAEAVLNRDEKQAIFELHNYFRALSGRNQMVLLFFPNLS